MVLNGYVENGVVYLNKDRLNYNTPIHEFGHLWINKLEKTNKALFDRGVELIKKSKYWTKVNEHPYYSKLGEPARIKEAMAMAIGDSGETVVNQTKLKDNHEKGLKKWIAEVINYISSTLNIKKDEVNSLLNKQLNNIKLSDFINIAVKELLEDKKDDIKARKDNRGSIRKFGISTTGTVAGEGTGINAVGTTTRGLLTAGEEYFGSLNGYRSVNTVSERTAGQTPSEGTNSERNSKTGNRDTQARQFRGDLTLMPQSPIRVTNTTTLKNIPSYAITKGKDAFGVLSINTDEEIVEARAHFRTEMQGLMSRQSKKDGETVAKNTFDRINDRIEQGS